MLHHQKLILSILVNLHLYIVPKLIYIGKRLVILYTTITARCTLERSKSRIIISTAFCSITEKFPILSL